MPIPTQAVWAVGEKTGGALAAITCCTAAVPARLTKRPSESTWGLLEDLRIVFSSATLYFASAVHPSQGRSQSTLQALRTSLGRHRAPRSDTQQAAGPHYIRSDSSSAGIVKLNSETKLGSIEQKAT
jgi:hypothetical protein